MNSKERFICGKCVHYIQHYRKDGEGFKRCIAVIAFIQEQSTVCRTQRRAGTLISE